MREIESERETEPEEQGCFTSGNWERQEKKEKKREKLGEARAEERKFVGI